MDNPDRPTTAKVIWPTAEEARDGYRNLQLCWPTWKQTLGLFLSSDDDLALVVSAIDYAVDDFGFKLRLSVLEKLVAPADFVADEYPVSCVWNQPYLDVEHEGIFAPYCFYLHFEQAGVERARELAGKLDISLGGTRLLRSCFGPGAAEFFAGIRSRHDDSSH